MKALIETPIDRDDPNKVKLEEIPLPPQDMWGELNNAGGLTSDPAVTIEEFATTSGPVEGMVLLDFVGDAHIKTVPLTHPFRLLGGELVEAITVRRLTIGQVGGFIQQFGDQPFTTFDVYAVMTGLPADVLRGLIDEDGDRVTDAAYGFLPLGLRPGSEPAAT